MILYTMYAKRIVHGRRGEKENNIRPITGLFSFAKQMTAIWNDANDNYPYALWWLSRISIKQIELENLIDIKLKKHEEKLLDEYDLENQHHDLIYKEDIEFLTMSRYAWEQARLIERFDKYCLLLIKLLELNTITKNEFHHELRLINKNIIGSMDEAMNYHGLQVTFENIKNDDSDYNAAIDLMGEIPSDLSEIVQAATYLPNQN